MGRFLATLMENENQSHHFSLEEGTRSSRRVAATRDAALLWWFQAHSVHAGLGCRELFQRSTPGQDRH